MGRRRRSPESWLTLPQRVKLLGLRAVAGLCLLLGRRGSLLLLRPVVLLAALLLGERRRASRRWLRRVGGRAGGFWGVYRHLLRVAQLRVDDVFLLSRRAGEVDVARAGPAPALRRDGRGALLVGAHLGSFGALRVLGDAQGSRVHVLAGGADARLWNALLRRLDPGQTVRLIEVGSGTLSGALQVRELIEQGELVALLADRAAPGAPAARVEFVGATAALPTAPYALAAGLRCPVHLVLALHGPSAGYELVVEPLLERVVVAGRPRDAALGAAAQRYAARLERHARRAPDDWANLYDFWAPGPGAARARLGLTA